MEKFNLNLPDIELLPVIQKSFRAIYRTVSNQNDEKNYAMSLFKAAHFINLRNERAEDLLSKAILDSMEIKANYFPIGTPRFLICIDGRVLTKLIACFHGNSYHVPAGDTKIDFLPMKDGDGKLFLRSGLLSKIIDTTISEQGALHEVLDSHLHCAAGGLGANDRHCCEVSDAGLWDDVLRKKEMKKAIIAYGQKKHSGKTVFVTQMSFNPDDGYSFFGLEDRDCLEIAKESGYTNSMIDFLVQENRIISTKKLAENDLKEIFLNNYFDCNYATDYRQSTELFWKNFQKMSTNTLPIIETMVKKTLSLSDETEIRQTASLILASAYNGFLHNHNADGSKKTYPYSTHRESVITVTISERGPFSGAESFFVHPDSPSISSDIKLGRSLIVGNRQKKRMSSLEIAAVNDVFGGDYDKYAQAPVLSFFFQRTYRELTEDEVNKLQMIDWSDVVDVDWFNLSNEEFLAQYLEKKWPGIPATLSYTINRLRQQAINIYEPNQSATEDFLAGRIIPIWAIAGPNRRIFSIIPFVINGYLE
jgi:hypothetical protein